MSNDEPGRRVYRLGNEHLDWTDSDGITPERPRVPDELQPVYATDEAVNDVDQLDVYDFMTPPEFAEESMAVEATPEELAEWRRVYAGYERAQQKYRVRMELALKLFEKDHREALADLSEALKPFAPVEEELKTRSAALAAKLHAGREAGREFLLKKQEAEEAALDAEFGPRALSLYPPKDLDSPRQGDHLAKVHLTDCSRRRGSGDVVRAAEAWKYLKNPAEWPNGMYNSHAGRRQMRVKLCSFCKPWTVLMEHAGATAATFRNEVKLEEWPDSLTKDLQVAGKDN